MQKSIIRTMLVSAMGFAWDTIKAGERVVAFAESWELHEGNQERAGFVELGVYRAGLIIAVSGERLEALVNTLAMKLGYHDGEVSAY